MTDSAHNTNIPAQPDAELIKLFVEFKSAKQDQHHGDRSAEARIAELVAKMDRLGAESMAGIVIKIYLGIGSSVYPAAWKFLAHPEWARMQSAYEDAQRLAGFDPEFMNVWGDPIADLEEKGMHAAAADVLRRQQAALGIPRH